MRIVPLPKPPELEQLLGGLLMRAVKVGATEGEAPAAPVALALYRTEAPVIEVAVLCDVPLAASLAAALSVVPAGAVKDCVAAGGLDPSLQDNFAEVMNVVSRYVSGSGRRFVLARVVCPPASAPEEILSLANGSDEKRELSAEIAGYAGGRIAFCTL